MPPLAEQVRIVGEIERLIGVHELVEKDILQNMFRIPRLRQAVLSSAFEGRLVDQDPNDEPAEVLLERIRAERAAAKGRKQSRPRRVNTRSASA
jgi:type I restriction enzyme S subunit